MWWPVTRARDGERQGKEREKEKETQGHACPRGAGFRSHTASL